MVLKTNAAVSKFEDLSDDEFDTPAAAPEAAAAPAPASQPATATVTALPVPKPTNAVAKVAPVNMADHDLLAALENRLPPVGFGEGTRLVGSNGNVMDNDKKLLGDNVELLLLSWNKRWVVSPGKQGDESREKARYSWDGVTTTQGEDIKEYIQELKDDGYDKAALKEYVDLFGLLTGSAKDSVHVGKAVTIALSPDSVKSFMGLRRDIVVQGLTGQLPEGLDPSQGVRIKITCDVKSANGMSWTRLVTSLA